MRSSQCNAPPSPSPLSLHKQDSCSRRWIDLSPGSAEQTVGELTNNQCPDEYLLVRAYRGRLPSFKLAVLYICAVARGAPGPV